MPTYLKKRGEHYYVQRKVPKHLQAVIGAKLVYRALGTSDRKAAEARRYAVLAEMEDEFARASAALTDHPSSPAWAQRVARELRLAVERGELDEQLATELMHDTIERHLAAAGLDRDTVTDTHAATLRASADMVTHADLTPLSAAIKSYLGEKEGWVQSSTLAAPSGAIWRPSRSG